MVKNAVVKNYDHTTIVQLEEELLGLEKEICQGAILRSGAQWAVRGDRNTKFFLNLEKQRQENKIIKQLVSQSGNVISDPDVIINEVQSFYSELYTKDEIDSDSVKEVLSHIKTRVDLGNKQVCDQILTKEELTSSIKGLSRGKSPGNDGITVEFYSFFWIELCDIFHKVCQGIFSDKSLSCSMRTGVISLVFKKRGS